MLEKCSIETELIEGPVDYSVLRPGTGPNRELPIVLWLHGGGGSSRFLETCQPQFVSCWNEGSLPDLVAVTPSAGWSLFLDHPSGDRWEAFLVEELVPHIRKTTGSTDGPLVVGGISVGAMAALRIAFRRPDLVSAVLALEPTIEAASEPVGVPLRDRIQIPASVRKRLYGDPLDVELWKANHPVALAEANGPAIAASGMTIFLECGDQDLFHAHYGVELLHRTLFDRGVSHEYRLSQGGNHVGPSVGPRVVDALRFIGQRLKPPLYDTDSIDAVVEIEEFAAQVKDLEVGSGYRQRREAVGPSCRLTVHVQGEPRRGVGALTPRTEDEPVHNVVMLPSLGRGAADFADLGDRIAQAGYRVLRPEPRGVGTTSQFLADATMEDFADDVAAVIDAFEAPAAIVGHDFGGQVAQMVAYLYPDLVSTLVLLAPPGPIQPRPEPATALRRVFIPELSAEEHLEAVAVALFAEGNDPVVWVDGWYPSVAFSQAEAERHLDIEQLWAQLRVKTLVVRPEHDQIVPAGNADLMVDRAARDLVRIVAIPGAGHALLPEQPEAVATATLSWLAAVR